MNNKKTYLTLCYTEDYLPMVITLYYTYLHTKSKYPFLALITDNIPKEELKIFDEEKIPYKVIPYYSFNKNNNTRWSGTINKLQYLTLTEYEYIMFLDADIFILENLDDIFDKYCEYNLDFIGYKQFQTNIFDAPSYLCGGTFIAKPNTFNYNNIIKKYKNKEDYYTDEQVLSDLFFQIKNETIYTNFYTDIEKKFFHDGGKIKFLLTFKNINILFFKNSNLEEIKNYLQFWNEYKFILINYE